MEIGQVVSGDFSNIILRQKQGFNFEIGDLVICQAKGCDLLLQVTDLFLSSQISDLNLERLSGNYLQGEDIELYERESRLYKMAKAKILLSMGEKSGFSKAMPSHFDSIRELESFDVEFLSEGDVNIGTLRSGSKDLKVPVNLPSDNVLSHHILVTGTTGKGKSEFMKNFLWNICELSSPPSLLIFDPHDEYYGRSGFGLKDSKASKAYYSQKDFSGSSKLGLDVRKLHPSHLEFMNFSDAQWQALFLYYKNYKSAWVKSIFLKEDDTVSEMSLNVLRRRLKILLDINVFEDGVSYNGVFGEFSQGDSQESVVRQLNSSGVVVVDTSLFSGEQELLVASILSSAVLDKHRWLRKSQALDSVPTVNIVLEEAPRVLGKDVLSKGKNVFSTIAREGRKFKVGLTAITQMPSLIPRQVLANINTKVILGTEMAQERQAIIDSSSQDISSDSKNIAGLGRGEAIVSSAFTKFALPIKFSKFTKKVSKVKGPALGFTGVKL